MTETELTEEILKAFHETVGSTVQTDTLSREELSIAEKLFDEKYSKDEWNVHAENPLQQT
jgi:lipoate-protein ligase A